MKVDVCHNGIETHSNITRNEIFANPIKFLVQLDFLFNVNVLVLFLVDIVVVTVLNLE